MTAVTAISWRDAAGFGAIGPSSSTGPVDVAAVEERLRQSVRNYARFPDEARVLATACAMALNNAGIPVPDGVRRPIGLVGIGAAGTLAANLDYFRDYVDNGSRLGRGNLFIYTLPSSALAEVSIALGLTGAVCHWRCPAAPLAAAIRTAATTADPASADTTLVAWAEPGAALCVLLGSGSRPSLFAADRLVQAAAAWAELPTATVGVRRLLSGEPSRLPQGHDT